MEPEIELPLYITDPVLAAANYQDSLGLTEQELEGQRELLAQTQDEISDFSPS